MTWRLYGLLGGAVLVLAALLALALSRAELADARRTLAGHGACLAAVKGVPVKGAKLVSDPAQVCAPEIADADRQARQLRACEQALKVNRTTVEGDLVSASNGAAVSQRCPAQTAALFGQTLADAATILGLRGVIDAAEADKSQAVIRAELRGRQLAERDHRANAVRESAPRDSDGLRVYDADRLRERWEVAP